MKGFALASILLGVVAPVVLAPRVASAQADDSVVEARARFREGVTLYDEGRYEAARIKFKQAYALKQHPDVLLNLGWSNLKSGHPQEAEENFNGYLHDAKDAPPAKRAEAEKGLAQAKASSGGGSGSSGGAAPTPAPTSTPTPPPTPAPTSSTSTSTTSSSPHTSSSGGGSASATSGTDAPAGGGSEGSEKQPIRVDLLAGYTSDYVNFGIGIRVGKVVGSHIYVGGSLVYNFGRSYNVATIVGTETVSTSAFYIGPEVGYEFNLAPNFVLRPYGGLGFASFNASYSFTNTNQGSSSSISDQRLLFWPGVTALYDIPNTSFTVGGDARLVFVPGGPGFGIFATGGIRF